MSLLLTAIASMMVATLAVHLGLSKAIISVISKIALCSQCATFWLTLSVMIFCDASIVIGAVLAISVAYLSNFFVLLLMYINNKYDELWQKLQKK